MKLSHSIRIIILIFTLKLSIFSAYKYLVIPTDKSVEPCSKPEGKFISYLFDLNFYTERYEDGTLYANATATWIYDKDINEPTSNLGQWIQEPYVVYRTDICKSMVDPKELFYPYFAQVNITKCPPTKGTTYRLKTQKMQVEIDIPGRNHEGQYLGVFRFQNSIFKICAKGYAELVRAN